jgi:hypothetical protein
LIARGIRGQREEEEKAKREKRREQRREKTREKKREKRGCFFCEQRRSCAR